MNGQRVARSFLPDLRRIEEKLTAPIPDRVRFLRELEHDLEALTRRLEAEGLPPETARARALESLAPDARALEELDRLHTPLYVRLTRRLDGRRLRFLERSALALATGGVLLVETLVLLQADLLSDRSPFLVPVLGLGALLFAAIAVKVFQLWIKGDHRRPEEGLGGILALSAAVLATGLGGVLVDVYRVAARLEQAPELAGALSLDWLVRDAALLSIAILIALAGGLAWFVLTQWLTLLSGARRDVLGIPPKTTFLEK